MKRGRPPKTRMPDGTMKIGFDTQTITLRLDQIASLKVLEPKVLSSEKFKQIVSSVREIGIIEPPVVSHSKAGGKYMLLDGHLRLEALRQVGGSEVECLVSTDDEAFTYNKHVNRLSTIQEHRMVQKAVKLVSEEHLAKVLNLDVGSIVRKRNLIEGICPEAVELLKDKMVAAGAFSLLRRMKPLRQIEAAQLMIQARTYSISYAKAILIHTPKEQLINPNKPKEIKGADGIDMMQIEMRYEAQKEAEKTYAKEVFNLTLAKNFIVTLLENPRIVKHLQTHHPEILGQYQKLAEMKSIG
ncbi:MAG: plasmid partitioning protein RepB C-terminal domain-containing protein [Alphaproteobacteria bacterium]|nr:plasmid partitioning protein RepB C-terminal domain-containing protein [Alphaproteobacteria bacterium]